MKDTYNRNIDYLRISLTPRCNLSCIYCSRGHVCDAIGLEKPLSVEKILRLVETAASLGVKKIRYTGGEPLLREDLQEIIEKTFTIKNISFVGVTTNAILLEEKIFGLAKAGLKNINVSLDTLNPQKYKLITGGGNILKVFAGLYFAKVLKLNIKINMVVMDDTSADELTAMKDYCCRNSFKLQLIDEYNLKGSKNLNCTFDRPPDCRQCNKVRILSDGSIKSCLHSDVEVKIDWMNIEASLQEAVKLKPGTGHESATLKRSMIEIGG